MGYPHRDGVTSGWIGVDFDGTLAEKPEIWGVANTGAPRPQTVAMIKRGLELGFRFKIFTARVYWPEGDNARYQDALVARHAIEFWCMRYFGQVFEVTCEKDYDCLAIWDDRAAIFYPGHHDISEAGTPFSGFEEKGPYHCTDCVHAFDSRCYHPVVMLDPALQDRRYPDGSVMLEVPEKTCCRYVRAIENAEQTTAGEGTGT